MRVSRLELDGVMLIEPDLHTDRRGLLYEAWRDERFRVQVTAADFVQDNVTITNARVIRGMHFQQPHAQGKLITVVSGAIYDVVLDVRRDSPSFGRWEGVTLEPGRQIWIPAGYAHGFQALEEHTVVHYKTTETHHPESERTVNALDPRLAITWPLAGAMLSDRDAAAPNLSELS